MRQVAVHGDVSDTRINNQVFAAKPQENESMSDFMEFGFGQGDETFQQKGTRYKGKENRTDRLSIVWWPLEAGKFNLDARSPRFIGAPRVYIKGVGYVMAKSPEYAKLAGTAIKKSVATIVIQWPTDDKGSLDKASIQTGFKVMSWVFSGGRYEQLARLHNEWPLGSHDFTFACSDTQYQKGDLTPCRESLFRMLMEKEGAEAIQKRMLAGISAIEEGIRDELARDLTLDQIREKLGADSPTVSGVVADAGVVDDMLDNLGV